MKPIEKKQILEKAKSWFRDELAVAHIKNTEKLANIHEFSINPFLASYLANFFRGEVTPISVAEILLYPRMLGTSINTSFGTHAQRFVTTVLPDIAGSTTAGIDIEFIDQLDKRKKYCQVKAGPNVINVDDVAGIGEKFKSAIRLARTNNLALQVDDMMFCLLYGEKHEKSPQIKALEKDFPVVMGQEFWHRLTGDEQFYTDLIKAIGEVANEFDMKKRIREIVKNLATEIAKVHPEFFR